MVTCRKCGHPLEPPDACPCYGLCTEGCPCEAVATEEARRSAPNCICIACLRRPEARRGVRLCRGCLEVAATALEAIRAEEARRAEEGHGRRG